MIKVFVVNLESQIERRNYILNHCEKIGLRVELIKAVDGNSLSNKYIDEVSSSEKMLKIAKRPLVRGEIGCYLSHLLIYNKMVEEKIEYAVILEDDIEFDESLLGLIKYVKHIPKSWECILLGHHIAESRDRDVSISYRKRLKIDKFRFGKVVEQSYGTYGYIISLEGAQKILNLKKIFSPIDWYVGDPQFLKLYAIVPSIVKIKKSLSDKGTINRDWIIISSEVIAEGNDKFLFIKKKINHIRLIFLLKVLKRELYRFFKKIKI